jgi:hypothetical protein
LTASTPLTGQHACIRGGVKYVMRLFQLANISRATKLSVIRISISSEYVIFQAER